MDRKFDQKLINQTIPLSLLGLGLLCISKPAMATGNISVNSDALNNIRQKAIAEDNNDASRPTLISNQMYKKALLTSFSENLKQNQSTFPNVSSPQETDETEFRIANNIQLRENNFEAKSPSLVALEWQNNDSTPINIPVSSPDNNQNTNLNSLTTPSSVDPTNYSPESQSKPVLMTPTQQASNFQDSQAIPIPVSSPAVINTEEVETNFNNRQLDSTNSRVLNNFNHKIHQVKSGETLYSIARSYGIDKNELLKVNNLSNANLIKVNQTLRIPDSTSKLPNEPTLISVKLEEDRNKANSNGMVNKVEVEPNNQNLISDNPQNDPYNDSSSQAQMISAVPIDIEYYNPASQPTPGKMVSPDLPQLYPPSEYLPDSNRPFNGYIWPAKGVLTSGYGWRWGRMHKGIDIAAPVGTPIVAASDGEVISAGWNSGGYGNLVKLKHFDGSITLYAHNSKIFVRRGQRVVQGQQIAAMGNTGFSTGPHLHFEIHPRAGKAANPMAFLPKK